MKEILLIVFVFAFPYFSYSQTGNDFKTHFKKKSGTVNFNLPVKRIKGNNLNEKSADLKGSKKPYAIPRNLRQPDINQKRIPRFFETEKSALKSANNLSLEEQFYSFHDLSKQITKLSDPGKQLKIIVTNTDGSGITHIKSQQYFNGIRIYGAESFVHLGHQKNVFTGYIYEVADTVSISPFVTETQALEIVNADLATKTVVKELSEKQKEILNYHYPEADLIIYENKLTYEIKVRPNFIQEWRYFVCAQTGEIIKEYNNTKTNGPATASAYDLNNVLRTINTLFENGNYYLADISQKMYDNDRVEGIIYTFDANNTNLENISLVSSPDNVWNNKAAVSAHYFASVTYDYLEKTFNRNSINNKGGNIQSFVNITDELGENNDIAYWNGEFSAFGIGGGCFKNLAGGLDVVAHEIGHGVVGNTANLDYNGQSGAINETYADIFGAMVDREDWLIGEDVVKISSYPSGALRDMSDPHNSGSTNNNYWQPKHLSEMYTGEDDHGGVHINSGIGNYAYYLYATAITKEKAEQVFYHALVNYLTSKSQFVDLRIAIVQSAKDLFGENSAEVNEAAVAFDAVGIYDEESIDYEQEYSINPGNEYLLTYDTDETNPYTLYTSLLSGADFYALSATKMKRRASVSDDGSLAVFVADDAKVKVLSTDPDNIQEFYLSDVAFFDNVAISKDGKRLAAVSTEIDTAIYVYDFGSERWAEFKLYNPTTSSDGTNAGGVLFADAVEFDHTGEYLIYDAYNELKSLNNDGISYWDIGFIKVWDNTANDFGGGIINKLYGSLPENVSIGNPTFSKNSPHIIAFDYFDSRTNEYAIFGANLLTGDVDLITTNATIGFPTFSRNDDEIAFSALNMNYEEVVATIPLATNKISGAGSSSILVNDAKWPVFYTVGNRSLELEPIPNFTADYRSGVAPFSVRFIDLSINVPYSWSWSFEGGDPASSNQQNPVITYSSAGIYRVSLTCTNNAGSNSITKTSYISVSKNTTSVDEFAEELISVFPNPTSGILNVDTNKEFEIEIFSMSGILLMHSINENTIDLSHLNNGIYFMKLKVDDKILTNKIVKQ